MNECLFIYTNNVRRFLLCKKNIYKGTKYTKTNINQLKIMKLIFTN